jgi:hypothetical protein
MVNEHWMRAIAAMAIADLLVDLRTCNLGTEDRAGNCYRGCILKAVVFLAFSSPCFAPDEHLPSK